MAKICGRNYDKRWSYRIPDLAGDARDENVDRQKGAG